MLQFFLGILVGGVFGFFVCAICSAAGTDDRTEEIVFSKENGDKDVTNE